MGRHKKEIVQEEIVAEEPKEGETKEKNMKYFLVCYLTDGTIHLWPADTKEECIAEQHKLEATDKNQRVKKYRYIKRNLSNYEDGYFL